MSERNRGKVVPFSISTGRMRKGAAEHRKRGRPMEALELLRQAARKEDAASDWLELATQMRELGCHEQALTLLCRLCAREDMPPSAWIEMALNQRAMGQQEAAIDSLYHYLQFDAYSDVADDVRDMLGNMGDDVTRHEAFRLHLLVQRALLAWQNGRKEESVRRFRRAMKISAEPARLHITLALVLLADEDYPAALKEATLALHKSHGHPRAMTLACVVLSAMGKERVALGLLRQCGEKCVTPDSEDMFLDVARVLGARQEVVRYLQTRLRQMPYRITLLHHMAYCLWADGQQEEACKLWQRILRIDPEDVRARALLHWSAAHHDEPLPEEGALPREEMQAQLGRLSQLLAENAPPKSLLTEDTSSRTMVDWCFALQDEKLQHLMVSYLSQGEGDGLRAYLRGLLTCPTVLPEVRKQVLIVLAKQGEMGPVNMLYGTRMTAVCCSPCEKPARDMWHTFLRVLLTETRRYRQSQQITYYAFAVWQRMSHKLRVEACGEAGYCWVKALELMYLRDTNQNDAADKVLLTLAVSIRRIDRIRRTVRQLMTPSEGENNHDEMH